jgi:hypothetical protein
MPNIWSIAEEDKEEQSQNEEKPVAPVVSHHEEEELERPSFLRRLTKRGHKDDTERPDGDSDQNAK